MSQPTPSSQNLTAKPAKLATAAHAERLLLSPSEAAELLGMSRRMLDYVRARQTSPAFPAPVVIGSRHVRYRAADLAAWVAAFPAAVGRTEPTQLASGKVLKRTSNALANAEQAGVVVHRIANRKQTRGLQQSAHPSNSHPGADNGTASQAAL